MFDKYMWYDSQRTKDIASTLNLVEVGANNGWMQASTGQYFKQCLEQDEKALELLTMSQKHDLGIEFKTKKITILVFKDYRIVTIEHSKFSQEYLKTIEVLKKNKDFVKDYDLNIVFD